METHLMRQEEKGWYTIGELAKKIQVSDRTVWSWIRDGKLRSTRYGQQHRITELQWQECFDRFNSKRKAASE
jgi:excisionase family DNA binding protein